MKNLCKNVLKWCFILMIIGLLCDIAGGVVFILAAIFCYKVFVKGNTAKETLKGGVNWAGEKVEKMKGS